MKKRRIETGRELVNQITGEAIVGKNSAPITGGEMLLTALNSAAAMGESDTIRVITLGQELYKLGDARYWEISEADFRLLKTCIQQSSKGFTLVGYGAILSLLDDASKSEEINE